MSTAIATLSESRRSGPASAFRSLHQAYLAWQQRDRLRRHLSQLEDRLLSDVGLTRGDIEHAVRGAFVAGN